MHGPIVFQSAIVKDEAGLKRGDLSQANSVTLLGDRPYWHLACRDPALALPRCSLNSRGILVLKMVENVALHVRFFRPFRDPPSSLWRASKLVSATAAITSAKCYWNVLEH